VGRSCSLRDAEREPPRRGGQGEGKQWVVRFYNGPFVGKTRLRPSAGLPATAPGGSDRHGGPNFGTSALGVGPLPFRPLPRRRNRCPSASVPPGVMPVWTKSPKPKIFEGCDRKAQNSTLSSMISAVLRRAAAARVRLLQRIGPRLRCAAEPWGSLYRASVKRRVGSAICGKGAASVVGNVGPAHAPATTRGTRRGGTAATHKRAASTGNSLTNSLAPNAPALSGFPWFAKSKGCVAHYSNRVELSFPDRIQVSFSLPKTWGLHDAHASWLDPSLTLVKQAVAWAVGLKVPTPLAPAKNVRVITTAYELHNFHVSPTRRTNPSEAPVPPTVARGTAQPCFYVLRLIHAGRHRDSSAARSVNRWHWRGSRPDFCPRRPGGRSLMTSLGKKANTPKEEEGGTAQKPTRNSRRNDAIHPPPRCPPAPLAITPGATSPRSSVAGASRTMGTPSVTMKTRER